jgi:hypothetical protein
MSKIAKKILLFGILTGTMLVSFADRGIGKKSKNKVILNINTNNSFKNSIAYNLKAGLKYKGSLLSNTQQQNNSLISTELVTYQKGNSIYIVPYKQKIIVPEIKQGYTGLKLIIKTY